MKRKVVPLRIEDLTPAMVLDAVQAQLENKKQIVVMTCDDEGSIEMWSNSFPPALWTLFSFYVQAHAFAEMHGCVENDPSP